MTEKKFRTKSGYCHIASDRIVFSRDGTITNLSNESSGKSITGVLAVYGLIAAFLSYRAFVNYQQGNMFTTILFGVFAVVLVFGIVRSRNYSAASIIYRNDIRRIVFKPGAFGRSRSVFEVEYNDNGSLKKRLIIMPGTVTGEPDESERAMELFRGEKMMS